MQPIRKINFKTSNRVFQTLGVLLLLIFTSCVQLSEKGTKSKNTSIETRKTQPIAIDQNQFQFQWSLTPSNKPYIYELSIQWLNPEGIPLYVFLNGKSIQESALASPYTLVLESNTLHRIDFRSPTSPSNWVNVGHIEVQTPKDLLIEHPIILDKATLIQTDRLFLSSEGSIQTQGFPLTIDVKTLIANKALIETFPADSKAASDHDGRSGGIIQILTKEAQGDLHVNLRGEAGGDGSDGIPWDHPQPDALPPEKNGAHICMNLGTGGWTGLPSQHCSCTQQPSPGKNGLKGLPGHPGKPAGHGGYSGSLMLISETPLTKFTLTFDKKPGIPGLPGKGGPGQKGGAPSPAGKANSPYCLQPADGVALGDGETGPTGKIGTLGKEQAVCIMIGQDRTCY